MRWLVRDWKLLVGSALSSWILNSIPDARGSPRMEDITIAVTEQLTV